MKAFVALFFFVENISLLKASPVLTEHSASLVEGNKGTLVRGFLTGAGEHAISSHDTHVPGIVKPKPRLPRKEGVDTTLIDWQPPARYPDESDKKYRARYLKSQSFDRVNREAKSHLMKHITDKEQASKLFIQFSKEERDRAIQNYETNRRLRTGGILTKVPLSEAEKVEKRREMDRARWKNSSIKGRIRQNLLKAQRRPDEELLKKAREFGIDPTKIHEKPAVGRRSEVKDRVHSFLLKHGHVTQEALSNAEKETSSSSAPSGRKQIISPAAKRDFLDNVQRQPRTKKTRWDASPTNHEPITQKSSPSTPPSSEVQAQNSGSTSSGESSFGGSPFPRRKRTKMTEVNDKESPNIDQDSKKASLEWSDGIPRKTRSQVAKRRRVQDTIRSIFGDL